MAPRPCHSPHGVSSNGVYSNAYVEAHPACPTSTAANQTINDNHIPGAIYFDTNVSYRPRPDSMGLRAVDNIANRAAGSGSGGPIHWSRATRLNPALYDVLGRTFRAGARFDLQG